ncbi:hypothetical protein T484DRAFT_1831025, partial [Baffinella frigidus]
VTKLQREVDTLKTEKEVALLSTPPLNDDSSFCVIIRVGVALLSTLPLDDDSSGLLREMKLQLIEKDAKIQSLEGQAASLKRNNVIQAVELQELHDHLSGMERQRVAKAAQQALPSLTTLTFPLLVAEAAQQASETTLFTADTNDNRAFAFPALPPLDSVRESPLEDADDEDGKMRAILMADEALKRAQGEIAALRVSDERRLQLELLLSNAHREAALLREEAARLRASAHPSPARSPVRSPGSAAGGEGAEGGGRAEDGKERDAEVLRSELAATRGHLAHSARAESRDLHRALQDAVVAETAGKHARARLQEELTAARAGAVGESRGAGAPPAPGPSDGHGGGAGGPVESGGAGGAGGWEGEGAAAAHPLVQTLELVDMKQREIRAYLEAIPRGGSGGGSGGAGGEPPRAQWLAVGGEEELRRKEDEVRRRDDQLWEMQERLQGLSSMAASAARLAASPGAATSEVGDLARIIGMMVGDIEGMVRARPADVAPPQEAVRLRARLLEADRAMAEMIQAAEGKGGGEEVAARLAAKARECAVLEEKAGVATREAVAAREQHTCAALEKMAEVAF